MRTVVLAVVAMGLAASGVGAQTPHSAATGGVEGDVYLTMQNGEVRKGAGQAVFLLADSPMLHEGRDTICVHNVFDRAPIGAARIAIGDSMKTEHNGRKVQQLVERDYALGERMDTVNRAMRSQIDHLIAQSVRDTTSTGMNAHYRFENEPPGSYVVYATWTIASREYTWWRSVEVRAGQTAKRDLDNSGAGNAVDFLINGGADMMSSRLYCVGPRIARLQ